jgi:hypothetical protein
VNLIACPPTDDDELDDVGGSIELELDRELELERELEEEDLLWDGELEDGEDLAKAAEDEL